MIKIINADRMVEKRYIHNQNSLCIFSTGVIYPHPQIAIVKCNDQTCCTLGDLQLVFELLDSQML